MAGILAHPSSQDAPLAQAPKWYLPTAVVAFLWNVLGCLAYLADVTIKPEDVAKMTAAQQAMYHSRPAWAVAAMACAVWFGLAGSLGLILKKRWATPLLIVSLVGVIGQDIALFMVRGFIEVGGYAAVVLQGCVLLIAIALVLLARRARAQEWIG